MALPKLDGLQACQTSHVAQSFFMYNCLSVEGCAALAGCQLVGRGKQGALGYNQPSSMCINIWACQAAKHARAWK